MVVPTTRFRHRNSLWIGILPKAHTDLDFQKDNNFGHILYLDHPSVADVKYGFKIRNDGYTLMLFYLLTLPRGSVM